MSTTTMEPQGPRPTRLTPARIGVYAFLVVSAAFFLLPLYVMLITSIKPMAEIRLGNLFSFPLAPTIEPWIKAWTYACTGVNCDGIKVGFLNSFRILVPSVIVSIALGATIGYALSFWRPRGANFLFAVLLLGAFIPYQVFLYPLVRMLSTVGLYNSLPGIVVVHTIFGLPLMTLLFRNFYAGIPIDLFKAARVDGGGFWAIFFRLMLPLSTPIIIVAVILQVTGIWNDFLFGLIFAGRENFPMTVELNNVVNTTTGEREYNVNMAATILTALVPLIVYFVSGRWFVRGIAAGAVKG
ncbi:carbohydrate ABC transporter permease [Mesorhizobium sp. BR1-1-16]|uniref:carbohydrate ABC transporter permease n=1 Tax=Mesorhizobium sp. BR1-1-16 TaxID=2876653 RepID=UPI001CCD8376|nr:carbohydrate ABC transporter permease [Mesorhizobium sp. BR1-1-16]MBZ9934930.1 carbohydrate ABC transporter permease [Mesorhizobium sp. BR1-1-16]